MNDPCGVAGLNRDFYVFRGNKTGRKNAENICADGDGVIATIECDDMT